MPRTSPAARRAKVATSKGRPALSRAGIVQAALQIVDSEGVDAVSMRRVAAEFDTGPASLYAYFDNKDALLEAVLTLVQADLPLPTGENWQDMLRQHLYAWKRLLARHADIAKVSFGRIPQDEHFVDVAERLLAAMIGGGVPAQVATWAMDVTALYVAADAYEGYLMSRIFSDGSGRPTTEVAEEYFGNFARSLLQQVSADRYPTLAAHTTEMLNGDGEQRFAFGVDMFIAGIDAQTRQPAQ